MNLPQTAESRPWGGYQILLDSPTCKVKKLIVFPGKRLSLQSHQHRSEHWIMVAGDSAIITIGKDRLTIHKNQHVYIPREVMHRIENDGNTTVEIIETQIGTYFGEDDIVRYEDDFGRV